MGNLSFFLPAFAMRVLNLPLAFVAGMLIGYLYPEATRLPIDILIQIYRLLF